jgi:hypothetical protein
VQDGDGLVVFRVLNATAGNGQVPIARARQEDIEQAQPLSMSSETRFDPEAAADVDGDGIENGLDNCPGFPNPLQRNTDSDPVSSPGLAVLDRTAPNGDPPGDGCDEDADNDGFPDSVEQRLAPGDDLHFFLCPSTTGDTDPARIDSDGDAVTDRAECILDSNPLNAAEKPDPPVTDVDVDGLDDTREFALDADPADPDTDDDGILDGIEVKGYGTFPDAVDTDADACPDDVEIASFDGNTVVNSNDLFLTAISFSRTDRPNIDVNKNGIVNSNDLLLVALLFNPQPCVLPD